MTIPGQSIRSLNFSTSQVLGAGIAAGALALYVWRRGFSGSNASACDTPEAGNESDEIVLYGFERLSDVVASFSPYVAKVEAWMRFVGLPYTKRTGSTAKAPKGQLPYIVHGKNVVADSTLIVKYLLRTYPGMDRRLSPEQEALSVMMSHFIENSVYYGLFYHRWIQPQGYESIKELLLAKAPAAAGLLVRYIAGCKIRPHMKSALHYQGLGRHSEADINFLIDEDLAALSQMLGDKEYLLGRHPCLADASAFGFLDNALASEGVSPEYRHMLAQYSNLVAYTERIRATYFDAELRFEETEED
ncbi:hypothetical protein CVIRNUC_005540 [Coccomyxa viridis]|uniref:GST C-terminal domain-containing protein n=1 Tax=Coccomyxa viridis TaxID=1274662 RepID=A0AAV1I6C8_9CHLO|nr:hypothetical protein CVIRNUC_005540 [Coccomyxa viridis]